MGTSLELVPVGYSTRIHNWHEKSRYSRLQGTKILVYSFRSKRHIQPRKILLREQKYRPAIDSPRHEFCGVDTHDRRPMTS